MDIKKIAFQAIGMDGKDKLNELYEKSALTIVGCSSMKGDNECTKVFVDLIDKHCGGWDESKSPVIYDISGEVMDKMYGLHGTNAYPHDMNIVAVPLGYFANVAKLATNRFAFEGRWFDDVVDNNARREEEQGNTGIRSIA